MQAHRTNGRITGHVRLVKRNRGPQFYIAYRVPDASKPDGRRQVQQLVGPAWVDGKNRPRKGRCPAWAVTRADAEARLREAVVEAERGNYPQTTTGVTFTDASTEWLRYIAQERERKPSTVADYRYAVNATLNPAFGEMRLEQVTATVIEAWRAELIGQLSGRTINKLLVILHGIFKRAQRVYGARSNPVTEIERQPQKRSDHIDVFDSTEVHALVRATGVEQDRTLFFTAAFTGLRVGELLALRWRDVDFERRSVHVRESYTAGSTSPPKSGKVRTVPMWDEVAARLDELSRRHQFTDDADLVFCGEAGEHLDASALRKRYKAALAVAELRSLRFHDLRHTFGTLAIKVCTILEVKEMMGHSDVQTTMVYLHYKPRGDEAERLAMAFSRDADLSAKEVLA
jgi:integrase